MSGIRVLMKIREKKTGNYHSRNNLFLYLRGRIVFSINIRMELKAALFDLDGVVFDTEPQYTVFWGMICREYHPDKPNLEHHIKGQTLVQIYDRYFSDMQEEQPRITERLNDYESRMSYQYIPGFEVFVDDLRQHGVKCTVVTSSNRKKMEVVYGKHPEFLSYFDRVLTSEDFKRSKPDPDCYLKGAEVFGVQPYECVGFEDSFNGLRAVRASGAYTVGLTTTNSRDLVFPLSDHVIDDFQDLTWERLTFLMSKS